MTIASVEGRLKSLCASPDGRFITHRDVDDALARVEGLVEYQLVQESRAGVSASIVAEDRTEDAVAEDSADALGDLFGSGAEISVTAVHSLLPEASGKFLWVKRAFPLETI